MDNGGVCVLERCRDCVVAGGASLLVVGQHLVAGVDGADGGFTVRGGDRRIGAEAAGVFDRIIRPFPAQRFIGQTEVMAGDEGQHQRQTEQPQLRRR